MENNSYIEEKKKKENQLIKQVVWQENIFILLELGILRFNGGPPFLVKIVPLDSNYGPTLICYKLIQNI